MGEGWQPLKSLINNHESWRLSLHCEFNHIISIQIVACNLNSWTERMQLIIFILWLSLLFIYIYTIKPKPLTNIWLFKALTFLHISIIKKNNKSHFSPTNANYKTQYFLKNKNKNTLKFFKKSLFSSLMLTSLFPKPKTHHFLPLKSKPKT